jgi:hypothetical protein
LRYHVTGSIRNLLITLFVLITLQNTVCAADWNPNAIPKNVPGFLLGFIGGIALHETGHLVVATSKGYTVSNDGLSLVYSPQFASRADRLRIGSAGFQAQWLASEAAFYYREKAPDLTGGVIVGHLAITAAYLTVLKNHRRGDVVGIAEASGLSTDQTLLIVLVPALLDGWRLLGTDLPAWVAPLSIGVKGACLTAVWTY